MKGFSFDSTKSGLAADELVLLAERSDEYRSRLKRVIDEGDLRAPEASLCMPSDTISVRAVEEMALRYAGVRFVVVIGIGGSNLGTLAIYDAMFGTYDLLDEERSPKMFFLDTVSKERVLSVGAFLKREASGVQDFVINVISKSGSTTETIVNAELLCEDLKDTFGDIRRRVVVTTDEGSVLFSRARELGMSILCVPPKVGGRYSVFSPVGLFPLVLAGVQIGAMLEGAKSMRHVGIDDDVSENLPLLSACSLFAAHERGIRIHNTFFFAPELESVGKWYRQLAGESLGKEYDLDGNEVHAGILPIVSVGSTDLHSMAQMYFGGPRSIFTTIVSVRKGNIPDPIVPENGPFRGMVKDIVGRSADEVMQSIVSGVRETYADLRLPFATIEIDERSPFSIGQFLQFKMMETMYLAHLLHVNAFDQPNVEQYKKATRAALHDIGRA